MATPENQDKNDDFFNLVEQDNKIENPFSTDEIVFRDKDGSLKILKGGEVLDFQSGASSAVHDKKRGDDQASASSGQQVPENKKSETKTVGKSLNIDKEVEEVIKKSGLDFPSDEARKKIANIIRLRLKGVRDQVQTRQTLTSSSLVGGMELDPQTTDKILALISQEDDKLHGKLRQEVGIKEPFSDLQEEARKLLEDPPASVKEKPVFKPEETKKKPEISASPAPQKQEQDLASSTEKKYQQAPKPSAGRPKIEDVQFKPKLVGPVEEIRSLSLKDFRRLAQTPEQAIEKILEKIQLLEDDSFTKKTQAIQAWKESPVQMLYLELGNQSMEEGKSISEIIKQRQETNQPTLTEEEVEAVIQLNKKLRY